MKTVVEELSPPRAAPSEPGDRVTLPSAVITVVIQNSGEDVFLLDTVGGEMFEVNPTAALIFSLCQRGATYEAAVRELAEVTGAEGQDALILEDVHATVKQLQDLGLCEP